MEEEQEEEKSRLCIEVDQAVFDERLLVRQFGFSNAPETCESVSLPLDRAASFALTTESSFPPAFLRGSSYYALAPGIFDINVLKAQQGWCGNVRVTQERKALANHWFDAFPLLMHFEFTADGEVRYHSRVVGKGVLAKWIENEGVVPVDYRDEPIAQVLYTEDPLRQYSAPTRLRNAMKHLGQWLKVWKRMPLEPDNAVVGTSIVADFPMGGYHGSEGRLVLHQEGLAVVEQVNPLTLHPKAVFRYADLNPEFVGKPCPLPVTDPLTGETLNVLTESVPGKEHARYRVVSIHAGETKGRLDGERVGRLVATFMGPATRLHSFAATANYAVVPIFPFRQRQRPHEISPTFVVGYYDSLEFDHAGDTLFFVVSRQLGRLVCVYRSEAALAFHTPNAFEAENTLFIDLATYEDDYILRFTTLERLKSIPCALTHQTPPSLLRRYTMPNLGEEMARFDGAAGQLPYFPMAAFHFLTNFGLEMTTINSRLVGQPNRFVYGVAVSQGERGRVGMLWNAVVKADTVAPSKSFEWHQTGCYPSAPVFIPRSAPPPRRRMGTETSMEGPTAAVQLPTPTSLRRFDARLASEFATLSPTISDEDDGVVMAIVLDVFRRKSFLVILDAHDLHELGRFWLPVAIPLSMLHGAWMGPHHAFAPTPEEGRFMRVGEAGPSSAQATPIKTEPLAI